MINRFTKIIILISIAALCGWLILSNSNCDYFQKRMYTKDNDRPARLFELCIKAQKQNDATGGGNVMICNPLLDDLTSAGKLKNFKSCLDYEIANKAKLKKYPAFNCYRLIYGNKKKKKK